MVLSSLKRSIMQNQVDALKGDKLLEDTEQFFKNSRALRKMIKEYKPSQEQSRATSSSRRRERTSSIY
ncbi:MAG: hypothetical protein ACI9TV_001897 [Sulfurimonas sp.]|jgi:hypothetical protein|uniref:hypothetical protein n=1 Tax=Sulfurimonas sp. TaxID=2022749 RepID=UPI0039E714D8